MLGGDAVGVFLVGVGWLRMGVGSQQCFVINYAS